jgi:hypothetical protein
MSSLLETDLNCIILNKYRKDNGIGIRRKLTADVTTHHGLDKKMFDLF